MNKRTMCLLSFALALGLMSTGYAEMIDSFESGVDTWEIMDPAETLVQSTEGVTDGAFSMQRNFTSGWHEIDLGGVSVDVLNANDILEVDVTTSVTAEQMGWWLEQVLVLQGGNASGSYYLQSPVTNVASPDGTLTTTTVSFEYRSLLVDGPITDWAKIRLIDNTGPGPNGILYYDNLRAVSSTPPPETTTVTIGDFEGGLDGWWAGDGFTLSNSPTGATLNTQAMQVDGPGDWHIDALLDLKPHREALASSGATITADVTAFDADMTTTWMNVIMVINGQNNDDSGANNNVGWQGLGTQDVVRDGQPHTYTWELPDSLTSVIAGVDDNIGWFELVLATNLDGASVTKFYIDNIQLIYGAPTAGDDKSTDVIIGNWEQDLDGWVVSEAADALFNDHNGVTLDNYSLDVYIPNGDWQTFLTLDVIGAGLLDIVKVNRDISVDVTRLVADFPTDQGTLGWDGLHMHINAGGDGWSLWQDMGYQAHHSLPQGTDLTQTATWNYGQYLSQIDFDNLTWFELLLISNANDSAYTGWVWFYLDNMKLSGAGGALDPQPADGATDVPVDTTLSWTPGAFAASHHLYFGTDSAKVGAADMDSDPEVTFAVLDANGFDPNGLEFNTQYFWRVDEVNQANPDGPWKGSVLDFTAANFVVVDDIESYNDIDPGGPGSNRIFETWTDGFGVETNGALVGNNVPPYADQTTVRNGVQSMPVYFSNTGAALQSEVERIWVEPQDWTVNGFNALKLYTHGAAMNTPGELYVIIEDSAGLSHKVTNPDSAIFTAEEWKEWAVSLDDVAAAGVDVTAVTKLVIGVANLAGQVADGLFYIDDIRVGFEPIGLVAHYSLENNVDDSSGNGYHGVLAGDSNFPVAYVNGPAGFGMAMQFDGEGGHQYVDLGTFNPTANTDQLTVALWARWDGLTTAWQGLIGKRWGDWDQDMMMWQIEAHQTSGAVRFQREGSGDVWMADALTIGQWYHLAVTFDGTTAKTYIDGALTNEDGFSFGSDTQAPLVIGSSTSGGGNPFNGALDEVYLYDIVLSEAEILQLAGK